MARRKTSTSATKLYAVSSAARPTAAAPKSPPKRGAAAKAPAKTAAPRRKSVAQAAKSDDELELLTAIRDRIAAQISRPDCPARELVALLKELRDVRSDIEKCRPAADPSGADPKADDQDDPTSDPSDDIDDRFDAEAL